MAAVTAAAGFLGYVARWRASRWLRGCERVGDDAELDGEPTLGNEGHVRIGHRFRLASRPTQSHMVTGPAGTLEIGDDVSIAHGAAIAAFARVSIGDGTCIGPYVVVMDTDFHVIGEREASYDSTTISIGSRVRIGSRVTILRGSVIHDGAEIVAGSVVSGVIAAGTKAAGVPARVVLASPTATGGDGAADVTAVLMQTFGLHTAPIPTDGPAQIPQWDSLGSLKLLLALEEAFDVTLDEAELVHVVSVARLAALVDRAVQRRAAARLVAGGPPLV